MDKPLVTLFVFSFNQEKFIREAVEAAFNQTYSPLELILSDDCSQDKTFEIMQELASAYRGPHTIVLNRNSKNLGLCGHVNRIMEMAKGELILPAAGDDISYLGRTKTTVDVWESCSKPPFLFFDVEVISEEPAKIKPFAFQPESMSAESMLRLKNCTIRAPSMAWHRSVFDIFGALPPSAPTEDKNIAFRAALLGALVYTSMPLVKYRIHGGNISHKKRKKDKTRAEQLRDNTERIQKRLEAFKVDLETASKTGVIPASRQIELNELLHLSNARVALLNQFVAGSLLSRFQAALDFFKTKHKKPGWKLLGKSVIACVHRRLPD